METTAITTIDYQGILTQVLVSGEADWEPGCRHASVARVQRMTYGLVRDDITDEVDDPGLNECEKALLESVK